MKYIDAMFAWLRSFLSTKKASGMPHTPASPAEFGSYQENFERALKFTTDQGFSIQPFVWASHEISNEDLNGALELAGVRDLRYSAAQCLKWCHYLAPYFETHLGCRVELTIGQLWRQDAAIFNPTWEDIERWASMGIQNDDYIGRKGMNLHAWLTAANGEIIDPTLLSTLAAVKEQYKKYAGGIACGPEKDMFGHRYFPLAIGAQIVETINNKSMFNLLAQNQDELYQMEIGFVVEQ